jgi:hypothetical protein
MVNTEKFRDWADGLRELQATVDRLVETFGEEAVKAAVENAGWTKTRDKAGLPLSDGGRPLDYDGQALMEIWLFVEAGTRRTRLSVNAFCTRHTLVWRMPGGKGGASVGKSLKGSTLRRRYLQAKATLASLDAASQRWWQDELTRRISAG